jgi:hypothetical protein
MNLCAIFQSILLVLNHDVAMPGRPTSFARAISNKAGYVDSVATITARYLFATN